MITLNQELENQIKELGYTVQAPKGRDNTYFFVKHFIKKKELYTQRVYFDIKTKELSVIINHKYDQYSSMLDEKDPLLMILGELAF